MEISVKEGMLHLQGVKFGKKSWRQIRVVLFAPSLHGVGRVELYMRDGAVGSIVPVLTKQGLKTVDKRVIRLDECLSVCLAPGEVCPADWSAFSLTTTKRTYILAAPAADDWVFSICELAFQRNNTKQASKSTGPSEEVPMAENELYSRWGSTGEYWVTVQRTEAAVRCNLSGSYLLTASTDTLTLRDPHTTSPLYQWPYKLLRRFGNDKETVTIEAGRRCDSGEGRFAFRSQNAAKIYGAIQDGIRLQTIAEPKFRGSSVPPRVSSSCSQVPLEDRTVPSAPLYRNAYQDMEVRRGLEEEEEEEEEEEDYVGQEEGIRPNSANAGCVYSLLRFNQGMGQPIRRKSNPPFPASPVIGSSAAPLSFKMMLSSVLTKDPAKTQPLPPPHPDY